MSKVVALKSIMPQRLQAGDLIGVISTSAPTGLYPRRFERGISALKAIGFRVRIGNHCRKTKDHLAGTPAERVEDLHNMFSDPEVKAIFTTVGGYTTNQLLNEIDWELVATHPKVLMGYSDVSCLLIAVWSQTGLRTFLGPALLPQFGEVGGLHPYTLESLRRTLMRPQPIGPITPSQEEIVERLSWEKEDDRPRHSRAHAGPRVVRPGRATGPIVAGNMGSLLTLAGTRLWPNFDGIILFLEEDELETAGSVDRFVTHLRQLSVFEQIAGLALGKFHPAVGLSARVLDEILLCACEGTCFPIVADLDFGHVDPVFLLPIGASVTLEARKGAQIEIADAAVK